MADRICTNVAPTIFITNPNTRDELLSSFAPIQISKQYTRQFRVWIQFYF